jgi:radical SAM protein with 4Fe4S-binding SPASM domain
MINLNSLIRLANIYWSYSIRQKIRTNYPPYRLWIEPTSRCNLKCVMCPNRYLERHQLGEMDFALFKKVIGEAKHFVHDVNIHHRGESLLHERLYDMIRLAKENAVSVKLHTNATLLNEKNAMRMLESGLDLISFSFDGTDKQTYERIRVGASFEKTIDNIMRFLTIKSQLRKKKPFAVLELMDFGGNDHSYDLSRLSEFKKQFESLPLDRLTVKKPHNFAGNVSLNTGARRNAYSPCTFLWHSLVVFWNGDISPCPQDFSGEIIVGNAKDNTIEEIFNSDRMIHLRKKALNGDLLHLSPCRHCDMIKRRRLLGIPIDSLRYLEK